MIELKTLTITWIVIGILTFIFLLFIRTAPYGRHSSKNWGPMICNKAGWILMEVPAIVLFWLYILINNPVFSNPLIILCVLWSIHYIHRAFIFPFRLKTKGKKMPLVITFSGILFNSVNTFLVGQSLAVKSNQPNWAIDNVFIFGLVLFIAGFLINQYSDFILINLRKPGEKGYKIPHGGLFKWVSCPNLLGEIMEWIAFSIMAQTLGAWTFAIWTIANLVPRAISHHKWYLMKFSDYPKQRKAFLPFLW